MLILFKYHLLNLRSTNQHTITQNFNIISKLTNFPTRLLEYAVLIFFGCHTELITNERNITKWNKFRRSDTAANRRKQVFCTISYILYRKVATPTVEWHVQGKNNSSVYRIKYDHFVVALSLQTTANYNIPEYTCWQNGNKTILNHAPIDAIQEWAVN